MLLRHLIVLIINARNLRSPSCKASSVIGQERNATPSRRGFLIGQIKLTRIHVAGCSPRGTGQTSRQPSLYDVERSGHGTPKGHASKLCSLTKRRCGSLGSGGADRDRTDDLKLAKLPLSQLSYGPKHGNGQ